MYRFLLIACGFHALLFLCFRRSPENIVILSETKWSEGSSQVWMARQDSFHSTGFHGPRLRARSPRPQNDNFRALNSHGNPKPIYPPLALKLKQEGTVVVEIKVSSEGTVEDIIFKKRSGHISLDQAVVDAVKIWKIPNPQKKSFWMAPPLFRFKLEENS